MLLCGQMWFYHRLYFISMCHNSQTLVFSFFVFVCLWSGSPAVSSLEFKAFFFPLDRTVKIISVYEFRKHTLVSSTQRPPVDSRCILTPVDHDQHQVVLTLWIMGVYTHMNSTFTRLDFLKFS